MIFVIPTRSSFLIFQPVVPSVIIIITIRNGLHNLLQRVRALVVHTTKIGEPDRNSLDVTEPVFLRPVDALKIEPSRRLK